MAVVDTLSVRLDVEKKELWVYDDELRVDPISAVLRTRKIAWTMRPTPVNTVIMYGNYFIEN